MHHEICTGMNCTHTQGGATEQLKLPLFRLGHGHVCGGAPHPYVFSVLRKPLKPMLFLLFLIPNVSLGRMSRWEDPLEALPRT